MNVRYFLLTSTLLLSACSSEVEVQVTSESAAPVKTTEVVSPSIHETQADAADFVKSEASDDATGSVAEADTFNEVAALKPEQAGPLLPIGRLIGIVDTGDYKKATIDNQGKVIRLQEGDDWQGWKIEAINRKKVVISQNNVEHSLLLLSEFRAPEPTQHQLVSQQMKVDNESAMAVVPQFTQEQLVELRSHLLMGRSGKQ